jgi:hypothetical protein
MGVLLGNGFVIGENIPKAMLVAKSKNQYLYSFDMLGEAAKTSAQAEKNLIISKFTYLSDYAEFEKVCAINKI